MKVSKSELRRIIRETVKAKLREGSSSMDEHMSALAGGIAHDLTEYLESDGARSNAYVIAQGMAGVDDDEFLRPGRYEDIDAYAGRIAAEVVEEIRGPIEQAAAAVLRSMMSSKDVK